MAQSADLELRAKLEVGVDATNPHPACALPSPKEVQFAVEEFTSALSGWRFKHPAVLDDSLRSFLKPLPVSSVNGSPNLNDTAPLLLENDQWFKLVAVYHGIASSAPSLSLQLDSCSLIILIVNYVIWLTELLIFYRIFRLYKRKAIAVRI